MNIGIIILLIILNLCEGRTIVACPRRNQYIQVQTNGIQRCVPCEACPKGKQKKRCSLWQGIECEPCPDGSYSDELGDNCKNCTECQPGYRIFQPCTNTDDTVCTKCPVGTYSSSVNARYCDVCIHCKPHEIQIHECNSTRNFNCGDCMQEFYRDSATGNCHPCSKCRGNDSIVVPECYHKNKGFSDKNCILSNSGITFVKDDNLEWSSTKKLKKDVTILITFILEVIFLCLILLLSFYIFILLSQKIQFLIRKARDASPCCCGKNIYLDSLDIRQDKKDNWTGMWIKKVLESLVTLLKIDKVYELKGENHQIEHKLCSLNNNQALDAIERDNVIYENQIPDNMKLCDYLNSWKETHDGIYVDLSISDTYESCREDTCTEHTNLKDNREPIGRAVEDDTNSVVTADSNDTSCSFPKGPSPRKKHKKHRRGSLKWITSKQRSTQYNIYSTL